MSRTAHPRPCISRRAVLGGLSAAALGAVLPHVAAAAGDAPLVALVHTQAAGDGGVIDGMIASLKRLAADRHVRTRAIYAADPANFGPILELLGEAGAAIVLVTFEEMGQPIAAVAPAFPATRFVQIYGDPMRPPIGNVRTVSYETYLAAYLAGVCGATLSRTGKIGYIGGASIPTLNADVNAMAAGARSIDPALTVKSAFVGSFQDPGKGRQIAEQMFAAGIDFVQCESSASDAGVIAAANAGPGRMVSAGSVPEFALGPQSVAAILKCDFGVSVYDQSMAALRPGWTAGHHRTGLDSGVVDFVGSDAFAAHAPPAVAARLVAAWPRIQRAKRRIIAGAITVPFETALV